jgi:murein DD-endopeptidase MepM/ murein hydrolase activator NlpD
MARLDQLERERTELEAELARLAEIARREAAERAAREAQEAREAQQAQEVREAQEAAEREAAARASRSRQAAPPREAGPPAAAASPRAAPSSESALLRPVGTRVTSGYGYRIHPIYKTRRLHGGTDFGGPCGVPVKAAEDGTIVRAGVNGSFGNQVVVNHGIVDGEPVATSYNHMSGFERTSGRVRRGDVVGYVGTTGASTGCHLHFEVYVNGSTTDPMGWL